MISTAPMQSAAVAVDPLAPMSLGQGAFTTKNLSAVVRKDYKVLTVDISKLPAHFGVPPDSRADVALNTAATIMGCWTGA